jgi:hypothetical protein
MSNFQKSTSRFSSRHFAIAIVLLAISTGAVHAENRKSATTANASTSSFAELVEDGWKIFLQLTGCAPPTPEEGGGNQIPVDNSEIDSEIEVDPPSYP